MQWRQETSSHISCWALQHTPVLELRWAKAASRWRISSPAQSTAGVSIRRWYNIKDNSKKTNLFVDNSSKLNFTHYRALAKKKISPKCMWLWKYYSSADENNISCALSHMLEVSHLVFIKTKLVCLLISINPYYIFHLSKRWKHHTYFWISIPNRNIKDLLCHVQEEEINPKKVILQWKKKKDKKNNYFFKMQIYIAKRRDWLQMCHTNDPEELFKILF